MTGHCNNNWACSPLKTVFRKLRDRYQSYCTTYKTHAMTTHHRGTGHTGKDGDLNSHADITTEGDTGGIDIGPNNNNESTNSLDTTLAFGGSEADGCLSDLLASSQANLTIITREKHGLWHRWKPEKVSQWRDWTHRTGTTESLSCAQDMTHFNPAPTKPFTEGIYHYTDTLYTTQKQTNLANSLLQDKAIFNGHDSTKLEDWLMNLETAADLTNESYANAS